MEYILLIWRGYDMNEYGLNIYTVSIPIITGFIAYLSSRYQFNIEFKKVKEQCETDIKKIEEQCKSDIKTIQKQCEIDIKKLKEQCEIDIKKLEKQSQADIEKIKIESDKQADIYEKNKKTDMYSTILSRVIENPEETIQTITKVNEKVEAFNKFNNLICDFFSGSAKSSIEEIACDSEIACNSGINSMEIRSLQTLISREIKKQVNIDNIIVKAREFIKEKESVSDDPVDQDWVARFFNIAQDVSDDEMRNLWAKILSDEIEKPKSYSLRTLEAIKNLSRDEAELITRFCKLAFLDEESVFLIGNVNMLEKQGIDGSDIIKLRELNIAQLSTPSIFKRFVVSFDEYYNFRCGSKLLRVENMDKDKQVEIEIMPLTTIGTELYRLIEKEENIEYFNDITEFIKGECNNVKILVEDLNNNDEDITYERSRS